MMSASDDCSFKLTRTYNTWVFLVKKENEFGYFWNLLDVEEILALFGCVVQTHIFIF